MSDLAIAHAVAVGYLMEAAVKAAIAESKDPEDMLKQVRERLMAARGIDTQGG